MRVGSFLRMARESTQALCAHGTRCDGGRTADDLFCHVDGFGGRDAAATDWAHTASWTSTPMGKSGAPGTMSSHPDPPPLDWLLHQNPPAGVYRSQLHPPTPYVKWVPPPPAAPSDDGESNHTVDDRLKWLWFTPHPRGLIHVTPLLPRSPFSCVPAVGSYWSRDRTAACCNSSNACWACQTRFPRRGTKKGEWGRETK